MQSTEKGQNEETENTANIDTTGKNHIDFRCETENRWSL